VIVRLLAKSSQQSVFRSRRFGNFIFVATSLPGSNNPPAKADRLLETRFEPETKRAKHIAHDRKPTSSDHNKTRGNGKPRVPSTGNTRANSAFIRQWVAVVSGYGQGNEEMTLNGSSILPRIFSALITRTAPAILGAALLFGQVSPASAIDVPADLHIDYASIVVSKEELVCLALNDYWEARSETMAGRIAVARVVLNRAMDSRFPANLCDVVKQSKVFGEAHRCQFSWYCDTKADMPYEEDAWRTSLKIATAILQIDSSIPDPTGGALWYHADFIRPSWAGDYETTTIIGAHVFYREHDTARSRANAPARKPFIYRMNAFSEHIARQNARARTRTYAAADTPSSPIAVQRGPAPSQPLAR
jgi:N-acetylmuramoyl-L-alanine amidase